MNVEESMVQLCRNIQNSRVVGGKWIFKRIKRKVSKVENVVVKLVELPKNS
jgi:hypothetical protein